MSTDASMLDDDDDFCDISEYERQDLQPFMQITAQLPFRTPAVSEESLKEDIEKVEQMRPDEVRWFYHSHKVKAWKPFVGFDSLNLEKEWRSTNVTRRSSEAVCVRGGMFEVNVTTMRCLPIYWPTSDTSKNCNEEGVPVARGTWFYDVTWQPVGGDLAQRVEMEHIARWKDYNVAHIKEGPSVVFNVSITMLTNHALPYPDIVTTVCTDDSQQLELMDNRVMHSMQLSGSHVEWYSVTDVVLYKDATAHRALRNIATKFGVSKVTTNGQRLRRGYHEDAMSDDKPPPITNLIFVVHGIGAKSDRCKIVRNTAIFRANCRRLEMKHFDGRVEFFPIEWRSKVRLDGDMVECITPKKGQGMRKFVNHTAMDIFYYTSPRYRNEIISALQNEMNKIYKMFIDRNPAFTGKVSIFAHSLGSVIFHDILTERTSVDTGKRVITTKKRESLGGLGFKPHCVFCIGSPLGLFLCLRGFSKKDHGSRSDIVADSLCNNLYNIYHPADPVAYRLEPLIYANYSEVPPLQVGTYAAFLRSQTPPRSPSVSSRVERSGQEETDPYEPCREESCSSSPKPSNQPSYLRSVSSAVAGGAVRFGRDLWTKARGNSIQESDGSVLVPVKEEAPAPPPPTTKPVIHEVPASDRIDYELQEGFTERKLGYASFTSHTSYWTNQDLGMFVLLKVYGNT